MTVASAIQALRRVGRLTVEGGTICCDLPDPTPAEAQRAIDVLREHKPEALGLLAASGRRPEPVPADAERHRTPWPPSESSAFPRRTCTRF